MAKRQSFFAGGEQPQFPDGVRVLSTGAPTPQVMEPPVNEDVQAISVADSAPVLDAGPVEPTALPEPVLLPRIAANAEPLWKVQSGLLPSLKVHATTEEVAVMLYKQEFGVKNVSPTVTRVA